MPRILFTLQARSDTEEIWDYVADNVSPGNAEALTKKINDVLHLILEQPFLGRSVEDYRKNTRRVVIDQRYLIFYEPINEGILVLRVLHGKRLIRPEDLSQLN